MLRETAGREELAATGRSSPSRPDQRAVVVELRAALRSLSVGGSDLVQGYSEAEPVTDGRDQHLAPWPSRVRDGSWSWRGQDLQLPVNELSRGTALHGLVRWERATEALREAIAGA